MSRVLVVDDNSTGLELRKSILEHRGHYVTCAADVGSAWAAFQAAAPEAVILDLRLPDPEDGLALIREIRAAAPDANLPVMKH